MARLPWRHAPSGRARVGIGVPRGPATLLALLVATTLAAAGCGTQSPAAALQQRLLTTADLPPGWTAVQPSQSDTRLVDTSCLSSLPARPKGLTYAVAGFVAGTAIPTLGEALERGPQARQTWQRLNSALAHCGSATLVIAGQKVHSTIRPLPFPRVGISSSAYAWAFTLSGVRIGFDLVLFEAGGVRGYVVYSDLGPPPIRTVRAFADAAAAKAEGKAPHLPTGLSVVWAPVQTVETSRGMVAYRSVGRGPALILITGYGGTMEGWDRQLVDTLAQHRRVVIFDNAGVGDTAALPQPLTIDAMADQTSAFITALGLKKADVLGWSMGGMIAQALSVRHPGQVRRLILCATFPGDGQAVRPSQSAINALNSGDSKKVMSVLFPPDQTAAQNTALAAESSYPAASPAPAGVVAAQAKAIDAWWAGGDAAGSATASIHVPTLIADGTEDRLDPLGNSYALARLIPGAKLRLYPDAGHAFLFQDEASFAQTVEAFLR